MTITTKDVHGKGNVVGTDYLGRLVTVERRARVLGKPTPFRVAVYAGERIGIPIGSATYPDKATACAAAGELVATKGAPWER